MNDLTPRTDAAQSGPSSPYEHIREADAWDFARTLECELAAKDAEAKQARASRHAQEKLAKEAFERWKSDRDRLTGELQEAREAVGKLTGLVFECEQDRLNAQSSGLETGWEHPGTQTSFKKVHAAALALSAEGAR